MNKNIDTIKNVKEKQALYAKECEKFKSSLKNGFYLESISIGYAILEDRLLSFLHYAGIVSRNNVNLRINGSVYPFIRRLLEKDDKYTIKIKDISVKLKLIKAIINLDSDKAQIIDCLVMEYLKEKSRANRIAKPGYMSDLCLQVKKSINKEDIAFLIQIDEWRIKRNQLVHALMNKQVNCIDVEQQHCAEEIYDLFRKTDIYVVKPFKVENNIRKKYNIQ